MKEILPQIASSTQSRCTPVRAFFSAYLDGAISGRRMQTIASHLETCASCHSEFEALRDMQRSLSTLGPLKPPADLGMKLRLAISHEQARRRESWFDNFSLKWQNAIRPLLLQASAGFAGTIVLLGSVLFLLGMVAAPEPVLANDEPLGAMTAPHYRYSAALPRAIISSHDDTIIVEAYVNSDGRVYDYKIVSGPQEVAVQTQIVDQLLLSVFEPARVFGSPIRGRAVMTFSGVSVQG
jgi:Putative zinc-finger